MEYVPKASFENPIKNSTSVITRTARGRLRERQTACSTLKVCTTIIRIIYVIAVKCSAAKMLFKGKFYCWEAS